MPELAARDPRIRSELLQVFAYLAYLRGEQDRAFEIATHVWSSGASPIRVWLLQNHLGATPKTALAMLEAHGVEHPWYERFSLDAQHSQRLFDEELARWS